MSQEITDILREWTGCDGEALNRLIPVVFGELRSLARQQLARQGKDHTLQPTALVHEAYMRLRSCKADGIEHRDQFFALASCLMRRILVDYSRQRLAAKRGGGVSTVAVDEAPNALRQEPVALETVLSVHQALGKLERLNPRQGRVVELRYFGGLTLCVFRRKATRHSDRSRPRVPRQVDHDSDLKSTTDPVLIGMVVALKSEWP